MENLSREELYEKAQEFKEKEDWNNYFIYMTMSANLEYRPAIYDLVRSEFDKQDYTKTLEFYEKTKEYGYSKAMLAYIYVNGYGGKIKDVELSAKYCKGAVEMGNSMAMVSLAYRHRFGTMGVEKDENKAIELYNKAIEKENPGAYHGLASYYKEKKDYIKAIEYFELAITHFYPLARNGLICTYQNYDSKDHKYVINYFLERDDSRALELIYGYTDNVISILKEKRDLEKEIQVLRKENREMRNHIESSPDGILYFEALAEWKAKVQ